jgi:hypothetical protein
MKGWIDIGSYINWEDYGGKWARRAADGSYYVLDFTNMLEACGEEAADCPFVCEVKRVDLSDIPDERIKSALQCVGLRFLGDAIVSDSGDEVAPAGDTRRRELVLVEACVSYGCTQPLESFSGAKYPARIRAEARRYAESLMKDAAALQVRLDHPVNAIGSTAAEYGRGDIDSALNRGPFDTGKNLMRRLHGLPPGE